MEKMQIKRVILSPVGGQAIHSIIEYFKKSGYYVVGIDSDDESIGKYFVDKFYTVPNIGGDLYKEKIIEIIKKEKIDLFITWLDPEVIFWNNQFIANINDEHNYKGIFCINYRTDLIEFFDKYLLYKKLETKKLETPKSFLVNEFNHQIGFPVIIKPRFGFGTRGVNKAHNQKELDYYINGIFVHEKRMDEYIIQEFIEGKEYTIDFFSKNNEIINYVIRQRISHKGISLVGKIVHDSKIIRLIRNFVREYSIEGINNIQVIKNNSLICITDFNSRPSGTIMFSINSGVDLLNNVLEKYEGKKITKYDEAKNMTMVRHLTEVYF